MSDAKAKKAAKPNASADGKAKKKKRGKDAGSLPNAYQVAEAGKTKISPEQKPRLQKIYEERVKGALTEEFKFKNAMEVPRLQKIVINCAAKDAVGNPKVLDFALNDLANITGQKPVLTRARKSIANFKVREGVPLGTRVTLRRARMYEFLDRLINVALPRVRDFRGISPKSFDGRGNYSFGVKEQIIFPEIVYDKVDKVRGFTVTIATTAKKNEHARALLKEMGMPFRK